MWGCGDRCLFLGQKCNFHPIWNSSSSTYGKSQENLFHTTGFRYTEILSLPIYYSAKPRILFKCSFIQGWSDIFLFVGQKKTQERVKRFCSIQQGFVISRYFTSIQWGKEYCSSPWRLRFMRLE